MGIGVGSVQISPGDGGAAETENHIVILDTQCGPQASSTGLPRELIKHALSPVSAQTY